MAQNCAARHDICYERQFRALPVTRIVAMVTGAGSGQGYLLGMQCAAARHGVACAGETIGLTTHHASGHRGAARERSPCEPLLLSAVQGDSSLLQHSDALRSKLCPAHAH